MKKLIAFIAVAVVSLWHTFAVGPSCYVLTAGSLNLELSHVYSTTAVDVNGTPRISITANLELPGGDTGHYDVMITEWRSFDGINEVQVGTYEFTNQYNGHNAASVTKWAPQCTSSGPYTIRLHIWVWPAGADHNQVSPSINYIQIKRP